MALQCCQADPVSLLESPHKRPHHLSLAARALQCAAEVKEALSARSPSLSIRFTESPGNGTSAFNSTTSPSLPNTTTPKGEYIVEAGDAFDLIAGLKYSVLSSRQTLEYHSFLELLPFDHSILQVQNLSINNKSPIASMMEHFPSFSRLHIRIDPCFDWLQYPH